MWVRHGAEANAFRVLLKKLEDKRPFGIPRRIWENNTKIALKDIYWDGVNSIYVAEDEDTSRAVTNTVMNLWFSKKYGNFLSSRETSFLVRDAVQSGRYVLTCQRNLLHTFFPPRTWRQVIYLKIWHLSIPVQDVTCQKAVMYKNCL